MSTHSLMHVQTGRDGVIHRRSFLRTLGAGAVAGGMLGWKDAVTLHAQELQRRQMSCILLFMRGGPSQFETFDPKPGVTSGGPTQAIQTAVNGIRIAEHWPNVARQMRDVALIRSVTNREGQHQRAAYQLHTGYAPLASLRYPSFGSTVSHEIGPRDFDLPHFVSVGSRFASVGSGFLGMAHSPFVVGDPNRMPANSQLPQGVTENRQTRRLGLMRDLERDFAESGGRALVRDHSALVDNAANLVRSPRLQAFDLSRERNADRDRYGRNAFGQGCLLARRLVEAGVSFIEVQSNGWDTHRDNFNLTRNLANTVDPAFAALIQDLRDRNRLDRTLIVWMGEFGRTPRINGNTGRDHYPRAFSVALAGGGIRGGQVIGETNERGDSVANRPVSVADLFCTFCRSLGVNPRRQFISPLGRPISIVDGGRAIGELFA